VFGEQSETVCGSNSVETLNQNKYSLKQNRRFAKFACDIWDYFNSYYYYYFYNKSMKLKRHVSITRALLLVRSVPKRESVYPSNEYRFLVQAHLLPFTTSCTRLCNNLIILYHVTWTTRRQVCRVENTLPRYDTQGCHCPVPSVQRKYLSFIR